MTGKELIEAYPKATNIIKEWFMNKMMEAMPSSNAPDAFKAAMRERGVTDEMIIPMFEKNPSALFEVFDSQGAYMETLLENEKTGMTFTYVMFTEGSFKHMPGKYPTRKEAEIKAVEKAMEYINKKDETSITEEVK